MEAARLRGARVDARQRLLPLPSSRPRRLDCHQDPQRDRLRRRPGEGGRDEGGGGSGVPQQRR
ncbi:hypothetical protein C4D60_Mb07t14920 [Musa balbisiana]|uniref:Uncharacterized protein n=1 Tax=Musa balbisiana TaxID=52838 RepID=A0A4S8JFL8_MUSBA|nr:hypothetical protein C4D60_Mb07t14920 [Musa balbisiana]